MQTGTEDGRQRTEDGGQRAEDGGQRTEDGGRTTEDGGLVGAVILNRPGFGVLGRPTPRSANGRATQGDWGQSPLPVFRPPSSVFRLPSSVLRPPCSNLRASRGPALGWRDCWILQNLGLSP